MKVSNLNFGLSSSDSEDYAAQIRAFFDAMRGLAARISWKKTQDLSKCSEDKKAKSKVQVDTLSLFMIAGEQSGEHLGSAVAKALKQKTAITLRGVGGDEMRKAGVSLLYDIDELSAMGIFDVVRALPRIIRRFYQARNVILKEKPDAVLLVDYAEFNLQMAKSLRKKGYTGKIIQFVSPTIWAWREGRSKPMIQNLDLLLTLLPFEPKYFEKTSLKAVFCGHPLAEEYQPLKVEKNNTLPLIGIFPGSRRSEIKKNLPLQIQSLKSLGKCEVKISVARRSLIPLIKAVLSIEGASHIPLALPEEKKRLMSSIDGALATSGTVNLELALHQVPTVTLYKSSRFAAFLMLKIFKLKLPFLCLTNLILNREIFPEFYFPNIDTHEVGLTMKKVIEKREVVKEGCADLKNMLCSFSPSQKAAEEILKVIK
jgi:lipid-A-disaccharide synthase